jgi:hypothetical protein
LGIKKGGQMTKQTWNPYIAGGLTGILLILSVWIGDHFFGASTTFARSASVVEQAIGIDTSTIAYFTAQKGKYGPGSLPNWQLMFVIGIGLGAFAAAKLSNDFKWQAVPDMWQEQFGNNPIKRASVAFFGGAVALFGARLAGG